MSKASALRIGDVRAAFHVIGDCRDVGDEPGRWPQLAMAGVSRLVGAVAVTGGEGRWLRPSHPLSPVTMGAVGLDAAAMGRMSAYMHEYGVNADPIFQALQRQTSRSVTRRRRELIPDRDWYRSSGFNDYRRPSHLDHQMTSVFQVSPSGAISCLALHRGANDRDFSERERALVAFFHVELGALIGGPLASALTPTHPLSPRLQQTLACLMDGDSEKQVAARMGISGATVHQYVTVLYGRFGVQSRAELLVRVLRRSRSDADGVRRDGGGSPS